MDEFKKHIQKNLHLVANDDMPDGALFSKISSSLKSQKNVTNIFRAKVLVLFKYAAAACVIALAFVGAIHLLYPNKPNEIVTNKIVVQKIIDTSKSDIVALSKISEQDTPLAVVTNIAKEVIHKVATAKIDDDTIVALAGLATGNYSILSSLKFVDSQYAQLISSQRKVINALPVYAENAAYFGSFSQDYQQIEKDERQIKSDIVNIGLNDELLNQLINVYQQKIDVLKNLQKEIIKTNSRFKQNRTNTDTLKAYYLSI